MQRLRRQRPPAATEWQDDAIRDWIRRATVIKWRYLHDAKEESMALTKTIRKEIGNIEVQLKKRVLSLEKDLANLGKKLEKKETEVKKLKDKMTSKFVKNVKKKVKKAKKEVAKRLTDIF
jgi:seryl-tRNA synthetase